MLDKSLKLNDEKIKSIKQYTIKNGNRLGLIFNAAQDLDMRGGGNIVGSEQSGHIREVGIELYYKTC